MYMQEAHFKARWQ